MVSKERQEELQGWLDEATSGLNLLSEVFAAHIRQKHRKSGEPLPTCHTCMHYKQDISRVKDYIQYYEYTLKSRNV